MNLRPAVVALCGMVLAVGVGPGCNSSQEIPLAKVPPPPPGFGQGGTQKGAPKGGSPVDADAQRR